jgi:transposase InsO family protein
MRGHAFLRSVLKDCFSCKLRNKVPETQIMALLPDFRTSGYAFETVGVDYFSPFNVKRGRGCKKRCCCRFTCLTIRAVHLEVAFSMDSDSFLCAFFRFIARRGIPRDVYSDNGTNFVGALDDFQRALERWDQNKIHSKLLSKGSNWHFGPAEAHHSGGAWERMIRSVRQVLFHLMSEQTLTDEALLTFLAEAEKVVNDRPIVMAASDMDAFAALTPNNLILRRQSPSLPPGDFDKNDIYGARWRQAHYLADVFWKRFTSE